MSEFSDLINELLRSHYYAYMDHYVMCGDRVPWTQCIRMHHLYDALKWVRK